MACYRSVLVRTLTVSNFITRNIVMAAQRRAKEAIDEMKKKNPYYEKYADKMAKLQQTSPGEFLNRVDNVTNPLQDGQIKTRTYSELLNPKSPRAQTDKSELPYKKLSDIMKIELIETNSAEEISKIWFEYHKSKDVLAATLTVAQYKSLMDRAKQYPIFLLPLPRCEGFEFIMLQFAANAVHFTPLLAYQVHGENAPECLTLVHYTEVQDKNLILMRGEYDSKVLSGQEAQCLANELQMFYCKHDKSKEILLDTFTNRPDEFKHMDLIKEVENIHLA